MAAILLAVTGCGSTYRAPDTSITPSAAVQTKAASDKRIMVEGATSAETIARAASDLCEYKGPRLPFMVYVNPINVSPEERVAFLREGFTSKPKVFATHPDAAAIDQKEIAAVDGESLPDGTFNALAKIFDKLKIGKAPVLTFTDKSTYIVPLVTACAGFTFFEPGYKSIDNLGVGAEIVGTNFMEHASTPDAVAFMAGRSLYYTSGPGAGKLNSMLLSSSIASGLLNGMTLGFARYVGDVKVSASNSVRNKFMLEADAFAYRAAIKAGASREGVLEYVKGLEARTRTPAKGKELPGELRFSSERYAAFLAVVSATTVQAKK